MNRTKRFLSVLLAVVMVLAIAAPAMAHDAYRFTRPDPIQQDETPSVMLKLELDKTKAHPGDTVTMTIRLDGEYQAHAFEAHIQYDSSKLAVNGSFEPGNVLQWVANCDEIILYNTSVPGQITMCFAIGKTTESVNHPCSEQGVIGTVKFTVLEDADLGNTTIAFDESATLQLQYDPNEGGTLSPDYDPSLVVDYNIVPVNASLEIAEIEGIFIKAEVDKTSVKPGDTFTLTLSIAGDYAASKLYFDVPFDTTRFEVLTVSPGSVISAAQQLGFAATAKALSTSNPPRIRVSINNDEQEAIDPLTAVGTICTAEFRVKDTAEAGSFEFNFTGLALEDWSGTSISEYTAVTSVITIDTEPEPVVFHTAANKNVVELGDEFTVTVSVTGDYSAANLSIALPYDGDILELVSVEQGELLNQFSVSQNGTAFEATTTDTPVRLNGTLFTATFKFTDENGAYTFAPTINAVTDAGGDAIANTVELCEVHVAQDAVFKAVPSKEIVAAGETFTVDLTLTGDYLFCGLQVELVFDASMVDFVDIEIGNVLTACENVGGYVMYAASEHVTRYNAMIPYVEDAISENGIIFTATFTAKETLETGSKLIFTPVAMSFVDDDPAQPHELPKTEVPCDVTVDYNTVLFKVSNATLGKKILAKSAEFTENDYPAPVAWYGHEFKEWSKTPQQINQELAGADTVTVEAIYELIQQSFTVTVISSHGTEQKTITGSQSFTVKTDPAITDENGNDLKFLNWTLDGTVISYDVKTSIRVEHDCTIEAHYDSVAPDNPDPIAILLSAKYDNVNLRETFVGYMAPLDGHRIVDCGILASPANGFTGDPEDLSEENAQYKKHYHPTNALDPVYYTWIKTNVNEGDVWYIKVFVQLEGADTVYSDCIIITAGTDFPAGTNANS